VLSADPEGLAAAADGLMAELEGKVKVGCFDYKVNKDLAGEFNVRTYRDAPRPLRVAFLGLFLTD